MHTTNFMIKKDKCHFLLDCFLPNTDWDPECN